MRKMRARLKKWGGICVFFIQSRKSYRKCIKRFNSGITIKEVRGEDIPDGVITASGIEQNNESPDDLSVTYYVAEKGSKGIGIIHLVRYPPAYVPYVGYWLIGLQVDWRYRGMGIGENLSLKVIERAKQEKARELHLLVNEKNLPAIQLYHKMGFRENSIPLLDEQLLEEKKVTGSARIIMTIDLDLR